MAAAKIDCGQTNSVMNSIEKREAMIKKVSILWMLFLLGCSLFGCQASEYPRRLDETNTLYVGSVASSFPVSFMPWLSREGVAPTIASMLYSTLFSYDEDTGQFVSLLAKEWYYVDEDGQAIVDESGKIDYDRLEEIYGTSSKTYLPVKIILNKGITWSDGEAFTAEDVYYTFDIGTNNALSNHAGALAWTSDLQHTHRNGVLTKQGIFTYHHGASEQGYFIEEEDADYVLYLHVNKVLGAVTTLFTTILILPEHIWKPIVSVNNQLNSKDPSTDSLHQYKNPVGCGPYLLDVAHSNAQVITLQRRVDYHITDEEGGPLYKVDTIKLLLYQELNVAIYALLKGHIDVLDASVSSNYMSLFDQREDLFLSNAEGTFAQTLVLNINPVTTEKTPLRNVLANIDFRKALALAVNQDELINRVLNQSGTVMSNGLMRESLVDFFNPTADTLPSTVEERLALANQLLDTHYPNKDDQGYRLLGDSRMTFQILGTPGEQEVISYLQIQFQKIGIEVKYQAKGSSPEKTFLYTSKFDMTIQGVTFSISNVDIMYMAHFVTMGTSSNYGRLASSALTSKINEMRTTLNLNRKYELIYELQPMIADLYYKIPLYSSNVLSVARIDRYTGYVSVAGSTVFNSESLQNITRVG
jgi:peptide/nickel transport system substrate-binding protein